MDDDIIFDSDTIDQLINKLPNKCWNGPDGISNFFTKEIIKFHLGPIYHKQ